MKTYKKNKILPSKLINSLFLAFLVTVSMFLFPTAAQAKVKIVFFCTDWNAKCREAKQSIYRDIAKYPDKIDYKEFNIDLNSTPDQIRALGLEMPDKIPFIVILDKNGNILYNEAYDSSSVVRFESVLKNNIK